MIEYNIEKVDYSKVDEVISNELLEQHLIISDASPELLDLYKSAAIEQFSRETNRALLPTEIIVTSSSYNSFKMPYGTLEILEVYDANDQPFTDYKFSRIGDRFTINGSPNCPLVIRARCGFDPIPGNVKLAIAMMVATRFESRESVAFGTIAVEVPLSQRHLLAQFRLPNYSTGKGMN